LGGGSVHAIPFIHQNFAAALLEKFARYKKSALAIRREGSTLPILGQPNGHAELALRQTPLGRPCMSA
jgi:hypothetical protein